MVDDDDAANAPLIPGQEPVDSPANNHDTPLRSQENHQTAPNPFIWGLTFSAGISGLLFGYDTGVISSTLVSIGTDLSRELTTVDKSLITSCTSLFALIASPVAGVLADRIGRKRVVLVADVLFIVGALWQAFARDVMGMIMGRSVVGLAVGGTSLVVPLYISELSPSALRGMLVTLSVLFITAGQVVAYVIGWALSRHERGWRWMVGLGAVPGLLQLLLMLSLPETPRWLMSAGRTQAARAVLKKVYASGSDAIVEEVLRGIEIETMEEDAASQALYPSTPDENAWPWFTRLQRGMDELFSIGGNRRALTIACLLQGLQQLCGFNSLMYFSATIFSLLGFSSPTLTSLSIALTNFTFTLIALCTIDRIGRRRILLSSIPVMIAGLLLCSIAYHFLSIPTSQATSPTTTTRTPWPLLILVALTIYVSGYALGLGNIAWHQAELFPLSVRSLGSGLSTATNWGCNFVVGLTFLPMMEFLTPAATFGVYAVVCAVGWGCVWRIYPETKGLGLEDVRALLKEGWGVEGSLRRGGAG